MAGWLVRNHADRVIPFTRKGQKGVMLRFEFLSVEEHPVLRVSSKRKLPRRGRLHPGVSAPAKGNDKGSVEGLVGFARRNFMVPVQRVGIQATIKAKAAPVAQAQLDRKRPRRFIRHATWWRGL